MSVIQYKENERKAHSNLLQSFLEKIQIWTENPFQEARIRLDYIYLSPVA